MAQPGAPHPSASLPPPAHPSAPQAEPEGLPGVNLTCRTKPVTFQAMLQGLQCTCCHKWFPDAVSLKMHEVPLAAPHAPPSAPHAAAPGDEPPRVHVLQPAVHQRKGAVQAPLRPGQWSAPPPSALAPPAADPRTAGRCYDKTAGHNGNTGSVRENLSTFLRSQGLGPESLEGLGPLDGAEDYVGEGTAGGSDGWATQGGKGGLGVTKGARTKGARSATYRAPAAAAAPRRAKTAGGGRRRPAAKPAGSKRPETAKAGGGDADGGYDQPGRTFGGGGDGDAKGGCAYGAVEAASATLALVSASGVIEHAQAPLGSERWYDPPKHQDAPLEISRHANEVGEIPK